MTQISYKTKYAAENTFDRFYRYSIFKHFDLTGKISVFLSSFATVGLIHPAPGTWGSLVAALVSYWQFKYLQSNLLIWAAVFFIIGWLTTALIKKRDGIQDPGYIVIDEVAAIYFVNYFVYFLTSFNLNKGEFTDTVLTPYLFEITLVSFVIFRIFDITKPSLIGYFDRKVKNSFGVMFDDIIAAIATVPVVVILLFAFQYFYLFN